MIIKSKRPLNKSGSQPTLGRRTPSIKQYKRIIISLLIISLMSTKQTYAMAPKPELKIIIFIHGTILPLLSPTLLKETIRRYWQRPSHMFDHYCSSLRSTGMYANQLIGPVGLHQIEFLQGNNHCVNWILSTAYRYMHTTFLPNKKQELLCYNFGWNGFFQYSARCNAAEELYQALINLGNQYQTHNVTFSIVAHSHGVNIALRLPTVQKNKEKKLIIHELISFGAPVQVETAKEIESEMFEKVYHFYSTGDWIQLMDIFTTQGHCSKRTFTTNNPKVTQVSLDINGCHPGHASLCFYGKRPHEYKLATYPLPPLVLAPWMISWLNEQDAIRYHLSIIKDGDVVRLLANGKETNHETVCWENLMNSITV